MWNYIKKRKITVPPMLTKVKKVLKIKCKNSWKPAPSLLLPAERVLIEEINKKTSSLNQNNVTRTKAYLDFYLRHPSIHWAFLGHMVSRNGGWNMTDLKGGMLPRLLTEKEAISFFNFLERGNWLIFQDAYPQFLLFEQSLKSSQNLFHLLQHFHVSTFMETIWNHYWEERDPYLLTVGLIINEQSYLETRILDNEIYKKEVFHTLEFKLQDFLSMNHILFPYFMNGNIKLVGQTLHHFESLHERILLGKRLYNLLFADRNRLNQIEKWAKSKPHTGSRKDYWPTIFNDVNEGVPGSPFKPRIKSCKIIPSSPKIYSPNLEAVWKNQTHQHAEIGDWFNDWKVVHYLIKSEEKIGGEIEDEYCKTLERLEFAAITKNVISIFD